MPRPRGHRPVLDVIGARKRVAILMALADKAEAGDVQAAKLILDRTDAVLSRSELTGAEGKPIALEHNENVAAELSTETLRDLDALAERANAQRGNGSVPHGGNGSAH